MTDTSMGAVVRVLEAVRSELVYATSTYAPIASLHEGKAVIEEELEEAWQEIKRRPGELNKIRVRRELIQTAAMAVRTIVDCLGVVDDD